METKLGHRRKETDAMDTDLEMSLPPNCEGMEPGSNLVVTFLDGDVAELKVTVAEHMGQATAQSEDAKSSACLFEMGHTGKKHRIWIKQKVDEKNRPCSLRTGQVVVSGNA